MPGTNGKPSPIPGGRGRLRSALRLAEVRLRLPMVLVVAALVVGRWDVLRTHWDRLTRGTPVESVNGHAISADTEYFCPMDPGVLSDWPGRCGVCNMALVRRKKGEAALLPVGVVARMQVTPYRVQLAGIRTEAAGFRPLAREWLTSGFVTRRGDGASLEIEVPPRQAPWIDEGSRVEVTCPELPGRTLSGRVGSLSIRDGWRTATVAIDDPPRELRDRLIATVRSAVPVASLEPFRSMPREPRPPAPGEPRRLYVCPEHADSTSIGPGSCPLDHKEREPRRLGELERVRWWCPMHPAVTAEQPGGTCRDCGGMELRPRVVAYAPAGQVLAVPQSAVVDTGDRKVVFVEEMPGMFDGVEVVLGPRCGDYYPVVRGLDPGQPVAIAGAFLLDAETRLNPGLAATYFGAGGGNRPAASANQSLFQKWEGEAPSEPRTPEKTGSDGASPSRRPPPGIDAQPVKEPSRASAFEGLNPEDRSLAERQKTCPVTGNPLGSMGTPDRQVVAGRVVFLCCSGCRSKLLADPGKYLAGPRVPSP